MIKCLLFATLILALSASAQSNLSHGPDCGGGWPTNMAQGSLKNAGLLNNEGVDFARTKTVRLASENKAKDLWHQVYLVTFFKKSGGEIQAIVIHDASMEECSMTGVDVYVVSRHLE